VANAYIDSVAITVMGGLATSTLFTLIALPVWYSTVEDVGSILARLFPSRRKAPSRVRFPKDGVLVEELSDGE
jgi:hypothetical protein